MRRTYWFSVVAILLAASGVALAVPGGKKAATGRDGQETKTQQVIQDPAITQEPAVVDKDCDCSDVDAIELQDLGEELENLPAVLPDVEADLPDVQADLIDLDGMDVIVPDPQELADEAAQLRENGNEWTLGLGNAWGEEEGWLGVEVTEVAPEKASELKLPAEGGVLVVEVIKDSPAAKAGFKVNDVITGYNGDKVKGTVQFRRLVRETPAGHTVPITVWRDGRTENLSVQISTRRDQTEKQFHVFGPHDFDFHFDFPKDFGDYSSMFSVMRPPLGIRGLDIDGQLAGYFAVPGGAGVLVEEVTEGSAAAKAGLKAGDVVVRVNGQEIKTTSELRSKLRANREEKTATLGVIRQGKEISIPVEIERPRKPAAPHIARRIAL